MLNYFETPELKLQYYVQGTIPFKTENQEIATYQIFITNDGSKMLEDINAQIDLPNSIINQSTIYSDFPIEYSKNVGDGSLFLNVSDLNPHESVTIHILATSYTQLPSIPNVQLRSRGVSGTRDFLIEGSPDFGSSIVPLAVSGIALAMGVSTAQIIFRRVSKSEGNQKDNLIYLCVIHDLPSEMERYSETTAKIYYRREADRFAMLAIRDPGEGERRLNVLKDLLKIGKITQDSRAIIHFNIAKIQKLLGNESESQKEIEEAKKISKKLIENRIKIDSYFKT